MARVAIEVVDAGLVVARDELTSPPSPGIALLDPGGLVIGRDAAAQARLKPVFSFDRFWSDLTADPLPRQLPDARSRADLAYHHLSQLWAEVAGEGDEVLFASSGAMRPAELGLLGGIAQAARIPVAGYVDLAVAGCAPLDARESVLHLDIQLHQAVLTELRGEEMLRRMRLEATPRVGLRALHAAWSQLVSEAMVRQTRFDPLHQAATEQRLFDRLPAWLHALGTADSVDVEIEGGAGTFGVTLRREQFAFAAEAYYTQLFELVGAVRRAGEAVTIALSARAASLPSLAERFGALADVEVVMLPEGAAARAALGCWPQLAGEGPAALVTALPRAFAPRQATVTGRPVDASEPTHVVLGGKAYPVRGEPLTIGRAPAAGRPLRVDGLVSGVSRSHCTILEEEGRVYVRDHSRHGTWLNGMRVSGRAGLAAGDRLRLGTPGVVLELVAVG